MKKTFLVGFLGLFLVGGFVTGLYLVNQQTNPSSSAQEIVNPVAPPPGVDSGGSKAGLAVEPTAASNAASTPSNVPSLATCQKAFGRKTGETGFIVACDLDKNGIINVLDLSKMK